MINYLYGALLLISLVLIYFANKQYNKTTKLISNGVKTTATVVSLITVSGSDGNTYKPVFEYTDKLNIKQIFKSEVSSNPPAYRIGEKIKIIYNPIDKSEVKTISYWGLYRWAIILLSIASPFLIIGGGYFLYSRN
jgi:hypothetical protein